MSTSKSQGDDARVNSVRENSRYICLTILKNSYQKIDISTSA